MKSIRGFTIGLVLGLCLAFSAATIAKNTTQNDTNKKESCCAMTSCCCKGDSCQMKEGKDGSCCKGDKSAAKKDGGCCIGGACNMKGMKHEEKKPSR